MALADRAAAAGARRVQGTDHPRGGVVRPVPGRPDVGRLRPGSDHRGAGGGRRRGAVVTLVNLRGLGDAARAFLLPTMVFIVGLLVIIVIGFIHPLALQAPQPGVSLIPRPPLEAVSVLLLLLKAFSAGCSALTGVEAIAKWGTAVQGTAGQAGQTDRAAARHH